MHDDWDGPLQDVFEERADDPGQPLCPHCLSETRPNAHFCHACLCPLSFYAGTAPFERIWAWPWIVWQAGRTPWPRPIHAWGATLMLGGQALAPIVLLVVAAVSGGIGWDLPAGLGPLLLEILLGVPALILIARAWANRARLHVDPLPDES